MVTIPSHTDISDISSDSEYEETEGDNITPRLPGEVFKSKKDESYTMPYYRPSENASIRVTRSKSNRMKLTR